MLRCMGCMAEIPQNAAQCPYCGYLRGTPPMEAYHLAAETILQGRYIVGRVLGYGGFGVTYIGWDAQLERVVAIKEFLPSTFATRMPGGTEVTVFDGPATEQFGFGLQRFLDEARRLAQFNGISGITDIYDTFSQHNTAYIVMQFLNGQDVKALLAARGPMPYEQAREIILKICDTLAPVHQTGIIHRDLSPDNIYITREGDVKLLDFGAARYESGVNSKSLSVILKPGYAPEEQYRSKGEQGSWTDVYALAATFYKMLTGVTPPDSLERAVRDEIKEPSKLGIPLPQSAENALMNALNIRKNDRTQTVQQFKEALLADGVERVKVKPGRADGGRLPLAGKIAIAVAAVGLVVVGILAATLRGGEDIVLGETAKLTDNYGNALADGQALVPNITGRTEEEARAALTEAGLAMVLGEYLPNPELPKGSVSLQQPEAGAVLDEGAEVTVLLSAGLFWDAYEEGLLPQFEGVTAPEAVAAFKELHKQDIPYYFDDYEFEHSATVAEGSVIRYEEPYDAGELKNRVTVVVSAGPAGSFCVRAPFLYDVFSLTYCAPENDDWPNPRLEASADGSSWQIIEDYLTDGYLYEGAKAAGYLASTTENIGDELTTKLPDFLGKSIQLRVAWEDEGGQTQSVPVPQTLTLEEEPDTETRIDSMEFVTWGEVAELLEQGLLDEGDAAVANMRELEERMSEPDWEEYYAQDEPYSLYDNAPVVARGAFPQSNYDVFMWQAEYGNPNWLYPTNNADENGVQTLVFTFVGADIPYKAREGQNYNAEVVVYREVNYSSYEAFSPDGANVTARYTTPLYHTITPSPALAALLGGQAEPVDEVAAAEAELEDALLELEALFQEFMDAGMLEDEANYPIVVDIAAATGMPLEDLLTYMVDYGVPAEQMERLRAWLEAGGYA